MSKKEFLYWDDPDSEVEGFLGMKTEPVKVSEKKPGTKVVGSKGERVYNLFSKLSPREKKRFIKLIEHEL